MNLDTNRRIRAIRKKRKENYILEKLKLIRNNNSIENITKKEEKEILTLIENDYNKEKNNLINKTIELFYNHKKFKIFINKEKYINKVKKYLYILDSIKNYLNKKYNINNNYSLYYCKYYAINLIDVYKNKKEIYKICRYLIHKISILEQNYSDITKELYIKTENLDEFKNIKNYETFFRNSIINQHKQMINTTNTISKNLKTLKYNVDETINNGFFGL